MKKTPNTLWTADRHRGTVDYISEVQNVSKRDDRYAHKRPSIWTRKWIYSTDGFAISHSQMAENSFPLDSGKRAATMRPNQQQYKRLVYLNMRDCTKLYAAQMCPHPQTEVIYGDLALERHYEELIWKATHIWNFERCSPNLLNRVHFQSLQRGEFNSSGLPRTNITACTPSPKHIYLHFFTIWCEFSA